MDNEYYEETYQNRYKNLPMILSIVLTILTGIYAIIDLIVATGAGDGYFYGELEIGFFYPLVQESTFLAFLLWVVIIIAEFLIIKQFTAIIISPKIVAVERLAEIRDSLNNNTANAKTQTVNKVVSDELPEL